MTCDRCDRDLSLNGAGVFRLPRRVCGKWAVLCEDCHGRWRALLARIIFLVGSRLTEDAIEELAADLERHPPLPG